MNWQLWAFQALLGKRLPQVQGRVSAPSKQPLRIRRDQHGVAYVDAQDEGDAWFGLGFCHAQDRAGQLELQWRLVRGLLSQVVGKETLPVDRAVRQLGIHRAAEAQLPLCDADVRDQLSSYVAGVNAALQSSATPRSHEHVLLRTQPSVWTSTDVIAVGLLTCCFLPSNWDVEFARLVMYGKDGAAAVETLDPTFPASAPLTSPPGKPSGTSAAYVARDLEALRTFLGRSGGSNAWAVAGSKTATSRPLLANDPHLPASLPNLGYLARVRCPSFSVAGISLVGVPAFISGHNGHCAWGSTAAMIDNCDLFLEQLSPDGTHVRCGDEFVACELSTEHIPVRGQADEVLHVRTTARGPVVARSVDPETSMFDPTPLPGDANALSFAATWLSSRPTRAVLGFHQVKNFAEFRQCCAASTGCAYSLVYADASSVGWVLATEVPQRKSGYGSLPLPGWKAEVGWKPDLVTSMELPWLENPTAGYVSCANNQPVEASPTSAFLGHDFVDGYRQTRISERLSAESGWTVDGIAKLQMDLTSLVFREVRPTLLALQPNDAESRRALTLLTQWDGQVTGESSAATVFELFLVELCQRACRVMAPNSWSVAAGSGVMKLSPGTYLNTRRASFTSRLIVTQPPGYFASWPDEMLSCLSHVVTTLQRHHGNDEHQWAWGHLRPLPLTHRMGQHPLLAPIFNRAPLRGYGDCTTVNQAGLEFWKPLRHSTVTTHMRAVIDVGAWEASRFVLLGGQSGNPLSKHYADLVPLWQDGRGVPIHWDDSELELQTVATLELVPPVPGDESNHRHAS